MQQCRLLRDLQMFLVQIYQIDEAMWQDDIVFLRMYNPKEAEYSDDGFPKRLYARIREKGGLLETAQKIKGHLSRVSSLLSKRRVSKREVNQLLHDMTMFVGYAKQYKAVLGREAAYGGRMLGRQKGKWTTDYVAGQADELFTTYQEFYKFLKTSHVQLDEALKDLSR